MSNGNVDAVLTLKVFSRTVCEVPAGVGATRSGVGSTGCDGGCFFEQAKPHKRAITIIIRARFARWEIRQSTLRLFSEHSIEMKLDLAAGALFRRVHDTGVKRARVDVKAQRAG